MASKTKAIIETDLYEVWMAEQAVQVVQARARTWLTATRARVTAEDADSLNVELRLLESGLRAGRKHDKTLGADLDAVWTRFLRWCDDPTAYVKRTDALWLLAAMDEAERELERIRVYLAEMLE